MSFLVHITRSSLVCLITNKHTHLNWPFILFSYVTIFFSVYFSDMALYVSRSMHLSFTQSFSEITLHSLSIWDFITKYTVKESIMPYTLIGGADESLVSLFISPCCLALCFMLFFITRSSTSGDDSGFSRYQGLSLSPWPVLLISCAVTLCLGCVVKSSTLLSFLQSSSFAFSNPRKVSISFRFQPVDGGLDRFRTNYFTSKRIRIKQYLLPSEFMGPTFGEGGFYIFFIWSSAYGSCSIFLLYTAQFKLLFGN